MFILFSASGAVLTASHPHFGAKILHFLFKNFAICNI